MSKKKSLLSDDAKRAIKEAKEQRKLTKEFYRKKVKTLRPYLKKLKKVDLRKDMSSAQKAVINRAWDDYQALTVRPTKILRTKKPTIKSKLQELYHGSRSTHFDVTFIPTVDPHAKVKINKKGEVILSTKYVDEKTILFNMNAMVTDPDKEIARVLAANPEFSMFIIMADEYLFNGPLSRSLVGGKINEMMARYSPGGSVYEGTGKNAGPNHHWRNWLHGIKGFSPKNQKSIEDYRREYNKKVGENKGVKNRERKQNLRKYGSKI